MNSDVINYLSVEIASKKVRMIYGYVFNDKPYILYANEDKIEPLKNGLIDDYSSVTSSIKKLKADIENKFEVKLNTCILVLPPLKLLCIRNKDSTNTVDDNNKICWVDVKNVLSKVSKINLSGDYKIINVIPYAYSTSNNEFINNPIGLISSELVVHASIYALSESLINNYKTAFNKTGLKVIDVVPSTLCTAFSLANDELVPNDYFLLNIGEEISTFSLVHGKIEIIRSISSQFGGGTITRELQSRLEINYEDAENYKKMFGISEDPNFDFKLQDRIYVSTIGEIIKDSLSKLVETIKNNTKEWMNEDLSRLPLVITGGSSKINGIKDYLKSQLVFENIIPEVKIIGARNLGYISVLGSLGYKNFCEKFSFSKDEHHSGLNDESINLNRGD